MDYSSELESYFYISRSTYFIGLFVFLTIIASILAVTVGVVYGLLLYLLSLFLVPVIITFYYKKKYDMDTVGQLAGFTAGISHIINSILIFATSVMLSNTAYMVSAFIWLFFGYSISLFISMSISAIILNMFQEEEY